jgi:osmotically-inducible protein OsmY
MRCEGSHTRESSGEYVDDRAIATKVKYAHLADPDVQSLDISGFVYDKEQVRKAVEITCSVHGVRSAKNSLIVK